MKISNLFAVLLIPKNALHLKKYRGHTFAYILLTMQDIYFFNNFILAVLGLHCCVGFSLVVESRGYSLVAVCGLLIAMASLIEEHSL